MFQNRVKPYRVTTPWNDRLIFPIAKQSEMQQHQPQENGKQSRYFLGVRYQCRKNENVCSWQQHQLQQKENRWNRLLPIANYQELLL